MKRIIILVLLLLVISSSICCAYTSDSNEWESLRIDNEPYLLNNKFRYDGDTCYVWFTPIVKKSKIQPIILCAIRENKTFSFLSLFYYFEETNNLDGPHIAKENVIWNSIENDVFIKYLYNRVFQ